MGATRALAATNLRGRITVPSAAVAYVAWITTVRGSTTVSERLTRNTSFCAFTVAELTALPAELGYLSRRLTARACVRACVLAAQVYQLRHVLVCICFDAGGVHIRVLHSVQSTLA